MNAALDAIFRQIAEQEGRLPEVDLETSRVISERGRQALIERYGDE